MPLKVVILAAGEGKRMHSRLPKVQHSLAGKPLLQHVVEVAETLNPDEIFVIYGHQAEQMRQVFSHLKVSWVEQEAQKGTGHAVAQVLPKLKDKDRVLVLSGDVPLISTESLRALMQATAPQALGLLLAHVTDPSGLGRVIRDKRQQIQAIVEEKDANAAERAVREIYSGILFVGAKYLRAWLPTLSADNAQGEYYLTAIIAKAVEEKTSVIGVQAKTEEEIKGVNTRQQLVALERHYQQQVARKLLLSGVTIIDPARFDLRGDLHCQIDVIIDINAIFHGEVHIGRNSYIGPNSIIRNATIGENVKIWANCVLEDCVIENDCSIGPFARVRPGTVLKSQVKLGNFVEVKKSEVGVASKINHLSYVGDATIGRNVNIGAGTITCNYDGVNKHKTIIKDGASIGSDTMLIAPVTIGENATIAAGSIIRKDAPANALTLTKAEQKTLVNWKRPSKKSGE